jgi:CRISPR/Cas system-associated exonuclease Cas4 (RecB family)
MLKIVKLYQGKTVIKFDDERHIFYDPKGNVLSSVTSATGIIDKSGALMGWTAKQMALYLILNWDIKKIKTEEEKLQIIELAKKEYRRLKQEAADLGTEIHSWVNEWIKGKKPSMPENEKVVNGITAFLKFQKEHKIKWIETERIVYSKKHGYAGILDAVGEIEGKLALIDFKSSNGIYDEMRFQVAGYQLAYEEETKKKIEKRMIIRFGKDDGEFEVFELGEDGKDKEIFLACLQIKRRLNELK